MTQFPAQMVGPDNRLSYAFFIGDDVGTLRPEISAMQQLTGQSPPFCLLPHCVYPPITQDDQLARYQHWLGENTRAPWLPWMQAGRHVFVFADEIDAVAFKLYIDR